MAEASTFAALVAAYSTAFTDLLVQADELKVAEEDRVLIRTLHETRRLVTRKPCARNYMLLSKD